MGISKNKARVYLNFAITPQLSVCYGLSVCFLIRKAARKSPFPSFRFICPKHALRAGRKLKRSGQICRPHVNRSVIMEQWETRVYGRQAQ